MSKTLSIKERASNFTKSVGIGASAPLISAPAVEKKLHSGPGNSILAMMSDAKVADENRSLREELKNWEGASPARKIDPAIIEPSRWANRHSDSYENTEFRDLKDDIESAGGNVQAIKVRPLSGSDPTRYEVVFGHRRHRACLELGLPVLAVIESITDQALFVEMDRENRQRADLRPYEQGEMYRRALVDGLYSSLRQLAEALGVNHGNVSRAVNIAKLPSEILDAFDRLEIQYRWLEPITEALKRNPDAVIESAKDIIDRRANGKKIPPKQVFDILTNAQSSASGIREVMSHGQKVLTIKQSKSKVAFELGMLSSEKIKMIEEFILRTLSE